MQNKRILGWAALTLMVGTLASAQESKDGSSVVGAVETPEGCAAVTDDGYNGTLGSMTCLTVAGPNQVISDVNVGVTMTHTWVGDIVLKLVSPSAQVLTLMSRPGLVEAADDGTNCCGSSADVLSSSLVTFDDEAGTSAESFVGAAGSYIPAPGAGPGTNLAQYDGQNAMGNWQVCMGDSAGGDPGTICSADLVFAVAGCTVDITCPGDQVGSAPPGASSGTVTFPAPTVGGTCAAVTTSCDPASGDSFPVGTTTVVCTASDASGASDTCSFDVLVSNQTLQEIPTASTLGLAALALLLAGAAFVTLRRG